MRRLLPVLAAMLILLAPGAALAHKLKVFAAVEGSEITGYAFFIGGGRPGDVPVTVADGEGRVLYEGRTDDEGGFRWAAPGAGDYVVTVNAEDGHAASATVPAARFAGAAGEVPAPAQSAPGAGKASSPSAAPASTSGLTEEQVAAIVQREMLPLLERVEMMDNRLRFTDVIAGIFLLIGGAGGALWLLGRGT